MFHSRLKSVAVLGVVVTTAAAPFALNTHAAEYVIEPSISGRTSYDNNLLGNREGSEIKTFMLELSPRLKAIMSTGKWLASFDGTVTAVRLEDDEFDSDNQRLAFEITRRTETVQFQIAALNDRQSTRGTELDELGEIGFDVERRDRQYLRPSVTWTLNPTNRLTFGLGGENVHYGGLRFSDYDYYSADIAWTHQYDEKTQFSLTTFGSDYLSGPPQPQPTESDDCPISGFFPIIVPGVGIDFVEVRQGFVEDFDSTTIGLQAGASRQPNERFSYRGSFGYRSVDTTNEGRCLASAPGQETFNLSSSSDGFVLDTGMTYQGEKFGMDLSITRSISPIGLGFLTERDSFNVDVSYRYSERVYLGLLVNGFKTESIDDALLFEREGLRITPRVNWILTEKLRLNGGVRFRSNESLTSTGKRDGITAFVGFNYNFKKTTLAR